MSSPLIIETDLRGLLPNVRDQGPRPLCLAFAASDFNSVRNQLEFDLSVEYLAHHAYKKDGHANFQLGLTTKSIIEVLYGEGQPSEAQFSYDSLATSPRLPPSNIKPKHYARATESITCIDSINEHLKGGEVVVACIALPKAFQTISSPYILDDEIGEIGNHAVLIVGKAKGRCGSDFFLIRNSWGVSWGDNGHCWLSEFFKNKSICFNKGS
ncbi:C1 family peptidase [Pseudoalteromonas sp. B62]|uniref:C1 family peptidase n=1 Tax=Pseudoalteromonas sp. B62 TaxID=630483 RepID=UPI00301B919D